MNSKQFETLTALVLPTSSVTLLVIGGAEYTGTGLTFDKNSGLVALTRTSDNVRMTFDSQAVYGFTFVPPPAS